MATISIIFDGGFHHSKAIQVRVPYSLYSLYSCDKIDFDEMLSDYQRKKLTRHFCGIKGCTCGSYHRADYFFY